MTAQQIALNLIRDRVIQALQDRARVMQQMIDDPACKYSTDGYADMIDPLYVLAGNIETAGFETLPDHINEALKVLL